MSERTTDEQPHAEAFRALVREEIKRAAPAPTEARREEVAQAHLEVVCAIAFLRRGPGGVNNANPEKWADMSGQIADKLSEADMLLRKHLALSPSSPDVLRRCGEALAPFAAFVEFERGLAERWEGYQRRPDDAVAFHWAGGFDLKPPAITHGDLRRAYEALAILSQLCERASAGEGEVEQLREALAETHNGRATAEARLAEMEGEGEAMLRAFSGLRMSAALLHQNSVGCAQNHHGGDFDLHGMPGWLADAEALIQQATALLATIDKEEG